MLFVMSRMRRQVDLIERDNLADHTSPHEFHRPDDTGDKSPRATCHPDLPGKREHTEHRRGHRQDKSCVTSNQAVQRLRPRGDRAD